METELERAREIADELSSTLQKAQQNLKTIEEAAENAGKQSLALTDNISTIESQLADARVKIDDTASVHDQIKEHHSECVNLEETCELIAKELKDDSVLVREHASALAQLKEKIEGLLPGATSAGLANAFSDQRQRFKNPKKLWIIAFVSSIAILILLGWTISGPSDSDSWGVFFVHVARRLLFAAPCIWLAVFSAKRYVEALRVEEDYAFKEALSVAFEGYKNQFAELEQNTPSGSPLLTLCNNQLAALSEPPGRLYEKADKEDSIDKAPAKIASELADISRQFAEIGPTKSAEFLQALTKLFKS